MKTKIALAIGIVSLATLPLVAGPSVTVQVGTPQPPPVVVAPPPVAVQVGVPDTYVWDGYEYVGVIGTQYYYLGAGNLWLPLDAPRVTRFHSWEKSHADWRSHAIRNENYRHDAHGHVVPRHDDTDHNKDKDHNH